MLDKNKDITRYVLLTGLLLLSLIVTKSLLATPAITPNCASGQVLQLGLLQTTYRTPGYNSYPANHAQYNTLIANYATAANLYGSGIASQVNGSGNPFGSNDDYLTIFTGYIEAPTTGTYGIGVDGDDAVEVIIDGVPITGWYGGHGSAGSARLTVNVSLDAGYHTIEFRHQENGGGDNYYLYWRPPGSGSFSIVPSANLSSCQVPPVYLPAVSPTCVSPIPNLQLSTYDTTGYGTFPSSHIEYNALIASYAIPAKLFGSGTVANINGSGNPYGAGDNYLSVFKGYIEAPTTGIYNFGVDGDDAVEVLIDGHDVSGYYGPHGKAGSPQSINSANLNQGYHTVEFRHQEGGVDDNYYLYWQRPGDTGLNIVPGSSFSYCTESTTITLQKTKVTLSDPVNLTANPKAIPGAIIRYTLTAVNSGANTADSAVIRDSLENIITTQQYASWVSNSINITAPSVNGGVIKSLSDAIDSDEGEFVNSSGNRVVKVNCGTLPVGQSCVVTYDVEIQ